MVFGSADGEGRKETSFSSSQDLSCEFLAGSECVCLCGGFNRQLEGRGGKGQEGRPQQTLKTHPAFKNGGEAWEIMVRCLDGAACCIHVLSSLFFSAAQMCFELFGNAARVGGTRDLAAGISTAQHLCLYCNPRRLPHQKS